MTEANAVVCVVDDDAAVREPLRSPLQSVGLGVETYASAQEFLSSQRPDAPGCLVLNVRLPGVSELDLQSALAEADVHLPIILSLGTATSP
jgi:FixJ family two-component response regulator